MNDAQFATEGSSETVAGKLALAIHEHRLAPGTKLVEDDVFRLVLFQPAWRLDRKSVV